ncbi:MAG: RNA 2',3'-cyclic phosphodiesterase [Gammaproteobacteria bacterium]|nr:RNA 2',3'-cyclic phosphodiesterase [Gammaproteobacteria bacterium]NIM74968.1 RNA 2',3'-cyclic phosphodiesterase [Gammaproteobacteria bacterium]NIN39757.1 RNA 2',3'-cyclic phosphodiesterase [Gammaproteobacteria bacterium]NIO26885.1 RNA 2',3'-cyclic phosphodiesterase [Gammaproteobacteria bacterium]NIO67441.1 RNA 2',3'-cyclic phosphodiesterase [Gammaproteobacteria bacterium]
MTANRQRLFFALWPDDETRDALARLARAHLPAGSGRLVPAENLHVTLVFLGAVDSGVRACAERAASALSAPAFTLEFVRIGYWPRPRVLWSAPERTPAALAELASTLTAALVECGHRPESRPFRAHITVARKVRKAPRASLHDAVHWRVDAFHLIASETRPEGARYRRLRSWPLQ